MDNILKKIKEDLDNRPKTDQAERDRKIEEIIKKLKSEKEKDQKN